MSTEVTTGSYWKERNGDTLVKVIVPDAEPWWGRGEMTFFRTCSKDPNKDAVQYCILALDFKDAFTPAIWQEGKWI